MSSHAVPHRARIAAALASSLAVFATGCALDASAPDQPIATNTITYRAGAGAALGAGQPRADVLGQFLRARGRDLRTTDSLRLVREAPARGGARVHLRFGQFIDGLRVVGADARATFDADGRLIHLIDDLVELSSPLRPAVVTADEALDAALGAHYPALVGSLGRIAADGASARYAAADVFYTSPSVTRVAFPTAAGDLAEGFVVETWTDADNLLLHTLVDGAGHVVATQRRTSADSYNIFPDHPGNSSQTVVAGPGFGNAESPAGWLSGAQGSLDIRGNNVHAYLDRDRDNSSDAFGEPIADGAFLAVADLGVEPTTSANQEVAVQNLFYYNNLIHDTLYRHGFTEAVGNFQSDNFGNGGAGGDAVNAEAQDGGGVDNANFATPADGSPGRMQMYLWAQSTPGRDGDVDSDIIWHEYGHGLTWRMIGNMSGAMAGAIGEGMSDVLAILVNEDDTVGEYAWNDPIGIRSAPYAGYARTYGDMGAVSLHFDGEIYAAAIWRLFELFQAHDLAKDTLLDDLIGGMNFTPSAPSMDEMRDGILAEIDGPLAPGSRACLVWQAFAEQGIGVGARGESKGGGPYGGGKLRITESFAQPAACTGGGCTPTEPSEVTCGDGIDNDCDGQVDGDDADCGSSCTPTEPSEVTCGDGIDNDCDGQVDGDDADCGGTCEPLGASCTADADCCSAKCRGRSGGKSCK